MGQFKDYFAEIQQSHVLGSPLYRLHTNVDGTFVTPIPTYDVTTMDVTNRYIATHRTRSELVYFVENDDGSGSGVRFW